MGQKASLLLIKSNLLPKPPVTNFAQVDSPESHLHLVSLVKDFIGDSSERKGEEEEGTSAPLCPTPSPRETKDVAASAR